MEIVVAVVVVVVAAGVGALSVVVVVLTLNSQVQIDFFDKRLVLFVMQHYVMEIFVVTVVGVVVVVVANASFSMAFPLETHPSLISKGKTCI